MAPSSSMRAKSNPAAAEATLARALAPEEIRPGDFVTPLHMIAEVPSYFWCGEGWNLPREHPVRIRYMPTSDGLPLRVKSLCLPFVLVGQPSGQQLTLDVRKCELARLDRKYAKRAWKAFKKAAGQKKHSELAC